MFRSTNIVKFLFLNVFLSGQCFAQQILTPQEAVQHTLLYNYDILIAKSGKEITEMNAKNAFGIYLPRVDINASQVTNNQDTRQRFLDGREVAIDNAFTRSRILNAALSWTIFDGFQMFAEHDRIRELDALEEHALKENIELAVFNTQHAYYNVVLEQQRMHTFQEAINIAGQKLRLVELRVEVGTASRAEALQARLDYNFYRSGFLRQKAMVENSKVELNRIMAVANDADYKVIDTIAFQARLLQDGIKEDALSANSALRQAEKTRNLTLLNQRFMQGFRYPTVALTSGYGMVNFRSEAGFLLFNQSIGFNYGITASWRIFDGFNTSRAIQTSRLQSNIAEIQYNAALHNLNASIKREHRLYANNFELLELEEENMEIARQNLQLAFDRFDAGVISAFQLKEAENSFNEASERVVSARHNAKISELQLLRLSGKSLQD
jgi:outer membrane protein